MREVNEIEIDLSAVRHNLAVLRRIVGPDCGLCPMLKADAYGLGAPRIARCLDEAGAAMFAVYTLDEAAALLEAGVRAPVLVLMPVRRIDRAPGLYRALVDGRIHLTVHDRGHLRDVIGVMEGMGIVSLPVHLEVDTGMSRGGCNVEEAADLLRHISVSPRLDLVGVFTHFAKAGSDVAFTNRQLQTLDTLAERCPDLFGPDLLVHVANTAAALRHGRYHRRMVRFGVAWAGYGAECFSRMRATPSSRDLRPVLTWRNEIVQVKAIDTGTPVGYGSKWVARRPTRLGLVPVGYADGFPGALGGANGAIKARVRVDGGGVFRSGHAPVVGAINMDQITIDLTDLWPDAADDPGSEAGVGATVEIVSPDRQAPNHLPTLARAAGISPHEMLSRLNPRIRRVYKAGRTATVRTRAATGMPVGS